LNRSWRIPPLAIVAAALGFAAAFLVQTTSPSAINDDRDIMLGTWTDEAGEPGNSIRFYLVEREIPGMGPIKAYDGRATVVKLLGEVEATATWNSGSLEPRVLNFSIGRRSLYIAIRKLDNDHIQMRFGSDAEEMYRPEAIDHPESKRFTRIGREPDH
jgi:hypothetical protein